jgi:hypothetical protein
MAPCLDEKASELAFVGQDQRTGTFCEFDLSMLILRKWWFFVVLYGAGKGANLSRIYETHNTESV